MGGEFRKAPGEPGKDTQVKNVEERGV